MKKFFNHLPLLLIYLIAIALSVKSLREPDLWWQIRTGEWIIEHLQIPIQDIFSFTYDGAKWVNVKWGFEVIAALLSRLSGPECVFILQMIVSGLLVYFLVRTAKLLQLTGFAFRFSLPIGLLISLVAIEYRINGRPEMFSHLFSVIFLFLLIRHRKQESNELFWLIPLQVIWSNFHEAFGVGIVLTGIFAAGSAIEYYLSGKKIVFHLTKMPSRIFILLFAQVAAVAINPNGITLLTRPLSILGQVFENKYTTELVDFQNAAYWQWNVYWGIGILFIGITGNWLYFRNIKTKHSRFKLFLEQYGIGYLIALVAFTYLALTAYRNIIFLLLVFFPLLVFGLESLTQKIKLIQKISKYLIAGLCILEFGFYVLIVSGKYYDLSDSHDRFGLEVLSTFNPVGAADFVKRNELKGKCFSDYLTSSYLLWKLQPDFKTFIDLRDLDIFPAGFFSTFAESVTYPEKFQELDSVHHFEYIVLFRPQFNALHNYLYHNSRFKPAYLSPVAVVYTSRAPLACETEKGNYSNESRPVLAHFVNFLLNPFFKYGRENEALDVNSVYANYFIAVEDWPQAERYAGKCVAADNYNYQGWQECGEIHYKQAMEFEGSDKKLAHLQMADSFYRLSVQAKNDFVPAWFGMGAVAFQAQNYRVALETFEKVIALDRKNLNAYLFAAECSKYFVNLNNSESVDYLIKTISFYKEANRLNPDNPTIIMNLGFLYYRNNDCDHAVGYLKKVADYIGFTEEQRNSMKDCIRKCNHP